MNIFVLDRDPTKAARYLMDKHVVKMALETAQILSTINGGPYKTTHEGHPCVIWAKETAGNYEWLVQHGMAICAEYTARYGKVHKCQEVIWLLEKPYRVVLPLGHTPHVQCMPELFKNEDPVKAYRAYYHTKALFAKWTKRSQPEWWFEDERL